MKIPISDGTMKIPIAILSIALLSLSTTSVYAQNETCIYFFYGEGCPHCARVEPIINNLENRSEYPVKIYRFEIYNNRSNLLLLSQYFDSYNIPINQRGVPVVFIGNSYLIGDRPIIDNIDSLIKANIGSACPKLNEQNVTGTAGSASPLEKLSSLSMFVIIGAALADSVNPCAIAVLLILLSALIASGRKRRALRAGLAFTISIYVTYFLFGLGLFSALQISGLSFWFYKIIGIVAVIIGLANIKDFFWYGGGGFVMEIPRAWRPTLKKMLSSVTSPLGAFLLGFAVCLFELPCTGGPYIVILGLLAERMTMFAAIPLLLIYNVFFVLPLLIITLMIYLGFSTVEKTTEWKEKNIRKLHLIIGLIMLVLGGIIVFGLV
ncbi:MAG: cytochrome c biogenesis protein CcdA [Candidatus Aenigmarchaeota archaeon]|nr:cytochrome c biogenesis protein CcdA [Candidatus Aenigmarchaeota archaeon]